MDLRQLSVPQTKDLNILGGLGAQIGIRGLNRLEHTGNLVGGRVYLGDREYSLSLEGTGVLCVLLGEAVLVTATGEGNSEFVTSGSTSALGVKESRAAVRRNGELSTEAISGTLGNELLYGEKERNALTARKLDGDGGIVDAIFLLELNVAAAVDLEVTRHLVKSVGKTSGKTSLHELGLATLELRLLLDGERSGLHAELAEFVRTSLEVLDVAGSTLDGGAGVGNAGTLDLKVGQTLQLVKGKSVGRLQIRKRYEKEISPEKRKFLNPRHPK